MSEKQQRQGFRLSVEKAVDAVNQLTLEELTPEVMDQLFRKGILLNTYLTKLETYDQAVFAKISVDTELELEIANTRLFNENVEQAIADTHIPPATPPLSVPPVTDNSQSSGGSKPVEVHLPKLEIPPFSGDPLQWQEFWDAFKAAIHDRSNLAVINKFTYLRGLLSGEALRVIEGFRVTEANYEEVVELLSQRYGDKQSVVFAHVDSLLSLPPASGEVASLISMHTTLERHLRSLDSLQPDPEVILQSVILSKLPRFLKVEAHRKKMSTVSWSLAELRKWLKDEVRAREMGDRMHRLNASSSASTESSKGGNSQRNNAKFNKSSNSSASALLSQSKEVKCAFCTGTHLSEECRTHADVEARRARLNGRCFSCLWKGHVAKDCQYTRPCKFCQRRGHHSSLCFKLGRPKQQQKSDQSQLAASKPGKVSHGDTNTGKVSLGDTKATIMGSDSSAMLTINHRREQTIMQTAVVHIADSSGSSSVKARLFFDTGASRSFITEKKQRELKLPVKRSELLSVSSFQSLKRQTREHNMVEFGVQCRDGSIQLVTAAVVPNITCPILKVPLDPQVVTVPDWSLAEPLCQLSEYVPVDILVGMDYYYSFVSTHRVQGGENLWFLSSRVGFLASGRVPSVEDGAETVSVMFLDSRVTPAAADPPLVDLSKYWELEEIGFKEDPRAASADEEAMTSFSSTVKLVNSRYQVCWPWKAEALPLKSNYGLAAGRLKSLLARLQQTPNVLQLYDEVIQSQLETGIVEKAPAAASCQRVYYIPHHCVARPDHSTTKLRVVFDASSKASKDAVSLNECLYRGPVLLEDLCGLLLRFRTFPIAMVSDIEKAFLQIGLQESQRDVTRFLWVRNARSPPVGDNLVVYRFCRVPFGVISSPFLLGATVRHHLKLSGSASAEQILRDLYVDNVITGSESDTDAVQFFLSAKSVFSSASMNLREWHTNSRAVISAIPELDRGKPVEPKVLGLRWNTSEDSLRLSSIKPLDESSPVTKRAILKTLAQVFDPCGFFAPVVVSGKLLLQDLWKLKIGWDDPVPAPFKVAWHDKISPSLNSLSRYKLVRHLGTSLRGTYQLHVFCDASARACAAAVYIRSESSDSNSRAHLVISKSRLAPISQKTTTPRLELIAVVLGARLLEFVTRHLHMSIGSKLVWTDSQCVLHWLNKDQVNCRFVENRLKELRKRSDLQFRYTSTTENPADLPTRGCSAEVLVKTTQWWHGPKWLSQASTCWPSFSVSKETELLAPSSDVLLEEDSGTPSTNQIIDASRYSSLQRLLRVTAYVLRYVENLRVRPPARTIGKRLLSKEIARSRCWWLRSVQEQAYSEYLTGSNTYRDKQAQTLGLFIGAEGLLRCSGRIQLAYVSYDAKHPVLLPKSGYFVDLLIQYSHEQVMHAGVASTLAKLREHFWIVHGRSAVKRVLHKCRVCHRFDGGPFAAPAVPPLPHFRLAEGAPFTSVGLDYLGPLYISQSDAEQSQKVWILLLTCAVTRAIHLEVTTDMSTTQLMLALRRFISLHGLPALLVSDNGRQFCTASNVFRKWWQELKESDEFRNFSSSHCLEWRFIPEMAPWMGGFYERLVAVVKQALRKSLFRARVTVVELQTVVMEIIAVVNSRPLLYLEDDVGSYALSPIHLISPSRRDGFVLSPSMDDHYDVASSANELTVRWRRLQGVVADFWRSWRSQYLLSLRERHPSHGQRGVSCWKPTVGTVVHLKQDGPRSNWRLGRIQSLITSNDGLVRSAVVRLSNGKVVRRPLKLLYPLEVDVSDSYDSGDRPTGGHDLRRPTRVAATRARHDWQQQLAVSSEEE